MALSKKNKPLVLIIRDGWGVSPSPKEMAEKEGNATLLARTPVCEKLLANYPHTLIGCSGESVGLPDGQMGNSEVGHLNLGAGRIVYQDFTRITLAVRDGSIAQVPAFKNLMSSIKSRGSRLHLSGLCSDGGVHSHIDHLLALVDMARQYGISKVFIHCIMDGRDTSPTSGAGYLDQICKHLAKHNYGNIVSIVGRYYAMDRDNRWERVEKAYNLMVEGQGEVFDEPVAAMNQWYQREKTDEFIPATVITNPGLSLEEQRIKDGDGMIFFNFRSDRAREITRALTFSDFNGFPRKTFPKIEYVCMTEYDKTFPLPIAFPQVSLTNIFTEVMAANNRSQLRIAETEKYPHVTFFFNGGVEAPAAGEERCLIPSPKVATYDLKPEMSAFEVTDKLIDRLKSNTPDVVILNYANADMVGHTGVISAAIKAIETVDTCVGKVLATVEELGGTSLITADHGNAERLIDVDGSPFTAHTTNPVHLIAVGPDAKQYKLRSGGILADVAPTMLQLMGLPIPPEMTGKSLIL